jgi:hypothetical protein
MRRGVDALGQAETMVRPAALKLRANCSALLTPCAVALRLPTTASAGG